MNHFITLFFLIALAFSQDNTGTTDCVCPKDVALTEVVCVDKATGKTWSPWQCDITTKCTWINNGCPIDTGCPVCAGEVPAGASYRCADGVSFGGPYCDRSTCKWDTITCEPYVEKTGYCPIFEPKEDLFCAATTFSVCKSDAECPEKQKCCLNECKGLSCQEPSTVLVKPGVCPKVVEGSVGICGISCATDGDCPMDKQKCCANACSGFSCTDIDSTVPEACDNTKCPIETKPQTFASTICPDGISSTGPYCLPVINSNTDPATDTDGTVAGEIKCDWGFKPCPDAPPAVNPGTCPIFSKPDVCDLSIKDACYSDKDCASQSLKCCYDGCHHICCAAVDENTCTVTGYRDSICLDKATAEATASDSALADTSILPGDECYRCSDTSYCSYNPDTFTCTRDDEYQKCLETCKNPPTEPVEPICNYKTSCDCLSNKCGWCQVTAYKTDETTTPFVWGYCSPLTGTNVCSGSTSAGGYAGSFFTVSPVECIDDSSVDPSIKDTSSYFTDPTFKEGFSDLNSGKVTEASFQKIFDTFKPTGCDVTIKKILNAVVNYDGGKGHVSSIIEVHDSDLRTDAEICDYINKAYAEALGIPEKCFKDSKLEPYSTTEIGVSVKRAVTSGQYIQTSTVDPSETNNTNIAGILAPMWMMIFAIFLFFRM